jgi:alkanesulfonate monooxygenase SsuD/methylene tetrahydromethanopterin reductase-like flavin-dependent oxidoreductase (luciferase family)
MEFGIFDHVDRSDTPLPEFYESRLKLVELYDRCGFYCYHAAEHHSTPLSVASSPSVYLSAVSQRTRNLRFSTLVYLLPFYHPLRLIEEICFLDQISRGRMQIGVGRGISPFEAGYFGLDKEAGRQRFDEILEIVLKGLTHKTLSHSGPTFRFSDVPMETEPYQKPHPPLWMGVSSTPSAAAAAEQGINIVSLQPVGAMRPVADAYWDAVKSDARGERKVGISLFIVTAERTDDALEEAERAYGAWLQSFNYLYSLHGRGPMLGAQPACFADAQQLGRAIAGTPAQVADFLSRAVEVSGVSYVVGQFAFGKMAPDFALRSVKLFAEQVVPEVRRFEESRSAAAAIIDA